MPITPNEKFRGPVAIDGAIVDHGDAVTPNLAAGVKVENLARPVRLARLTLTNVAISITAAQDFGSIKLLDFPAGTVIVFGVNLDLVATVDGTVLTDVTAIDYAVGTVALATTDFSGAGEDNLVAENDVAALGVMNARTTAALALPLTLNAGNNDVYLNAQAAVASGTGVVTLNGTVDVFYMDIGS